MFRELRRPRGDPEVLAAQSREQYFKVHHMAPVDICICVLLLEFNSILIFLLVLLL